MDMGEIEMGETNYGIGPYFVLGLVTGAIGYALIHNYFSNPPKVDPSSIEVKVNIGDLKKKGHVEDKLEIDGKKYLFYIENIDKPQR